MLATIPDGFEYSKDNHKSNNTYHGYTDRGWRDDIWKKRWRA